MGRAATWLLGSVMVVGSAQVAGAATYIWAEVDAGGTPGTIELVTGNPADSLIRIQGTIDPLADPVDLFRIAVTNAASFSARTTNGDSADPDLQFDAKLALFKANGIGVYANDDRVVGDGNAELPAGHGLSPTAPGEYLLAIYDDNFEAVSAFSMSGSIFPLGVPPFTAVLGPTGPGGTTPLIGFATLDAVPADARAYTIELTGARPLPEPGSATSLMVGLVGLLTLHAGALRRVSKDRSPAPREPRR